MAYSRKTKEQSKGKYTDLKQRLVFLALALVVYRIGAHIPVPGIDPDMLQQLFNQQQGGILGLFNMFSGGALSRFSLFALGIMPYISAAIILQMLSYVMPSLEALRKEGESRRRKITLPGSVPGFRYFRGPSDPAWPGYQSGLRVPVLLRCFPRHGDHVPHVAW